MWFSEFAFAKCLIVASLVLLYSVTSLRYVGIARQPRFSILSTMCTINKTSRYDNRNEERECGLLKRRTPVSMSRCTSTDRTKIHRQLHLHNKLATPPSYFCKEFCVFSARIFRTKWFCVWKVLGERKGKQGERRLKRKTNKRWKRKKKAFVYGRVTSREKLV